MNKEPVGTSSEADKDEESRREDAVLDNLLPKVSSTRAQIDGVDQVLEVFERMRKDEQHSARSRFKFKPAEIFLLLAFVVLPIGWWLYKSGQEDAQRERFRAYLNHHKCEHIGETVVDYSENRGSEEPVEIIHQAYDCHDGEEMTLWRFRIMEDVAGKFENGAFR